MISLQSEAQVWQSFITEPSMCFGLCVVFRSQVDEVSLSCLLHATPSFRQWFLTIFSVPCFPDGIMGYMRQRVVHDFSAL